MTNIVPAFELGEELAHLHERSARGRVNVVPVIVDDLRRAIPVLRSLCEMAEGRLLDASDQALQKAVPATVDPVRRHAIQGALSYEDSTGTRRVLFFQPNPNLIDARYDPAIGTEPSTGERTVLAVARAVAHQDLDDHEIAVITYSESGIDYPFRRCLWSLAVDQLADLPHGTLRTLVFVAESSIDIDLHCQTGRGFRFALIGSRLLKRHNPDDLRVVVNHIAQCEGPVVFFLGAGFGASSKLPLGNSLRDNAIRRLLAIPGSQLASSDELARRFYKWISERSGWLTEAELSIREDNFVQQLTLEQVIRAEKRLDSSLPTLREFRANHDGMIDSPGPAVICFATVLERMVGRAIVVEVNFDQLVEKHCEIPLRVFFSDEHFNSAPEYISHYLRGEETAIPVLKLHGSIEEADTCVVSDDQTQQGVGKGKLAALRAILSQSRSDWIYIGYSMRDLDLIPIFRSEDFANGLEERWVAPYLDAAVEEFAKARTAFWAKTELKVIDHRLVTETADAFLCTLRESLK